ncbi:hypothetical protein LCGC14_1918260 [marine sediment metagenome]|uniref:Uncharacterized protein n=1 Tax=marine sediment metagenome TaxID=412755 RepID=A0A0F9IPB9_9ZZZZ
MSKEQMRKEIVEMTANQKGCKVEDLESKVDKHGNVHVRIKNETS